MTDIHHETLNLSNRKRVREVSASAHAPIQTIKDKR